MTKTKYIVMVINKATHEAKRAIITYDLATAQRETRIRVGQGKRAYYIEQEVKC